MKYICLSIMVLMVVGNLRSQDFKKDMAIIYDQQAKAEKICFNIIYTLHENHNYNSNVLYRSSGRYIKYKDRYLSTLGHITSLVLQDMIVMINKEEKKIIVKKQKQKAIEQPDILTQLKSYEGFIEKITPLPNGKASYTYIIELKQKAPFPISKYEITISSKNKAISKISLFYKKTLPKNDDYHITGKEVPRMDIEFIDYNKFELFNESEMSSTYYYTHSNKKILPTQNFKGYDVKQF